MICNSKHSGLLYIYFLIVFIVTPFGCSVLLFFLLTEIETNPKLVIEMYFSLYICLIQAPTLLGQFVQINAECDLFFSHSNISLQNIGREQLEFQLCPLAMLVLSIAGD